MTALGFEIGVPCSACSTNIRFGELCCSSCQLLVSPQLRDALERRLESTSAEFRTLKHNVFIASTSLLIIGIASLCIGFGLYYIEADSMPSSAAAMELVGARISLAGNLLICVAMVACFFWARRSPTLALITALVAWLALQIAMVAATGLIGIEAVSLRAIIIKIAILAVLLRGIGSAIVARRLRSKLTAVRQVAMPVARVVSGG